MSDELVKMIGRLGSLMGKLPKSELALVVEMLKTIISHYEEHGGSA